MVSAACCGPSGGSGSASASMSWKHSSHTQNEATYRRPTTEQRSTTTVAASCKSGLTTSTGYAEPRRQMGRMTKKSARETSGGEEAVLRRGTRIHNNGD